MVGVHADHRKEVTWNGWREANHEEVAEGEEAEPFRWVKLNELANEPDITLPIDVVVVKMLRERFGV